MNLPSEVSAGGAENAAVDYAARGWRPIRVAARSKIPVDQEWQNIADTTPEYLVRFADWEGNVGVVMGQASGIIDLEVDPQSGGDDGWLALVERLGPVPETVTFRSGRGGLHRLFRAPAFPVKSGAGLAAGVDVRGEGGQAIMPPSLHVNGHRYEWVRAPEHIDPATLPQAWLDALRAWSAPREAGVSVPPTNGVVRDGTRRKDMLHFTAHWLMLGMAPAQVRAAAMARRDAQYESPGTFADTEIDGCIASAVRKGWTTEDPVPAIVHGGEVAAALVAEREAATPARIGLADPGPLPGDLVSLPGIGGQWIDHCLFRAPLPQPELALGAVLAACGALIGPRLTAGTTRANIYCFGLADTGHGKNAAREGVMAVLHAADAAGVLGNENIKSDAGLVTELLGKRNRVFLLDEAGYLLAAANAKGAGAHLTGIPQTLLQLYSSSHLTWKGGAYADAERNPTINCPHACIYATSTPGKLWDAMTMDSLDGGLLGRCLFFFGDAEKPKRRRPSAADQALPVELVEAVKAWTAGQGDSLMQMNGDAADVPVSAEAEAVFTAELERLDEMERNELKGMPARAVFTRVVQTGERLALIRAWCRDQVAPRIEAEDAIWGCAVALHCARRLAYHAADRVRGDDNPYERTYGRVKVAIQAAGGSISRQALLRAVRVPAKFLDAILDHLAEAGDLAHDVAALPREQGGGNAIRTYRLLT